MLARHVNKNQRDACKANGVYVSSHPDDQRVNTNGSFFLLAWVLFISACGGGGGDSGGNGGGNAGGPNPPGGGGVPTNQVPTASASVSSGSAYSSQSVSLSATASRDSDGSISTYRWTVLSGPAITFSNTSTPTTGFIVPPLSESQVLRIELEVTDNSGARAATVVSVNLGPAPVSVEMTVADGAPFKIDTESIELLFKGATFNGSSIAPSSGRWSSSIQGELSTSVSIGSKSMVSLSPGTHQLALDLDFGPLGTVRSSMSFPVLASRIPVSPILATPAPGFAKVVPIVMVTVIPTVDGIHIDGSKVDSLRPGGWSSGKITDLLAHVNATAERTKFMLEEGTKFRGYKNSRAVPFIGYQVVEHHVFYTSFRLGDDIYKNARVVDVQDMLLRVPAQKYVNEQGVRQFWMWAYQKEGEGLWESNMSSPTTGDISNSDRNSGDLPIFDHTYIVYGYNYHRSQSEAVHNHGHQMEAMLSFVDAITDGKHDLFWNSFVGIDNGQFKTGRCGSTHYPLNATKDYDYYNSVNIVLSDCQDWRPDGSGLKQSVSLSTWADIPYQWPHPNPPQKVDSQWYIYWMQNIPGLSNGIPYLGSTLSNWWAHIYDWDEQFYKGATLVEGVIIPPRIRPVPPSDPVELTVGFQAEANELSFGDDVVLKWQTASAQSCLASGAWSGTKERAGTQEIEKLGVGNHTFSLTCTDVASNLILRTANVEIVAAAPRIDFQTDPIVLLAGMNTVVGWKATGAEHCNRGIASAGDSALYLMATSAIVVSTNLPITCTNAYGSTTKTLRIEVAEGPSVREPTIYTDPSDPRHLSFVAKNGARIVMAGAKRGSGAAGVDSTAVIYPDGRRVDHRFNVAGQLTGLAAEGIDFEFDWVATRAAKVTVTVPGAAKSSAMLIDLNKLTSSTAGRLDSGKLHSTGTLAAQKDAISECLDSYDLATYPCEFVNAVFGNSLDSATLILTFCTAVASEAVLVAPILAPQYATIILSCAGGLTALELYCYVLGADGARETICSSIAVVVDVLKAPIEYELVPLMTPRAPVLRIFRAPFFGKECFAVDTQIFRPGQLIWRVIGDRFAPTFGFVSIEGMRTVKEDCLPHTEGGAIYRTDVITYQFPFDTKSTNLAVTASPSASSLLPTTMCGYMLKESTAAKVGFDFCAVAPTSTRRSGIYDLSIQFYSPDPWLGKFYLGGTFRPKY